MAKKYIEYINKKNNENKSASKEFYIIIQHLLQFQNKEAENQIQESIIINYLNEAFFKIKETLSRCGNIIYDINSKEEIEHILYSFINPEKNKNF